MLPAKRYPTDAEILATIAKWGHQEVSTYVIANSLRMDGFYVKDTMTVRQSLERMVRRGQAVKVDSIYGGRDFY